MRILVVNSFHNYEKIPRLIKELNLVNYKRHASKGCPLRHKGCACHTKVYIEVNTQAEADKFRIHSSGAISYWKRVDPTDLELRDAGYGVRI